MSENTSFSGPVCNQVKFSFHFAFPKVALTSQSYGSPLNPLLHPIFLTAFIKFKDIGRLLFAIQASIKEHALTGVLV